jgi:hypothetical protein
VAFTATDYDNAGAHDTSTNNSRLTVPVPGVYSIGGYVPWAANGTGDRDAEIQLNGSTTLVKDNRAATGTGTTDMNVRVQKDLFADDYVELKVTQTSGGALNVAAGVAFWIERLAG